MHIQARAELAAMHLKCNDPRRMKPSFRIFFCILSFLSFLELSPASADCSEAPLSYSQFVDIAKSPAVHDLNSFLGALPKHSLTNVTLVHHSESLQKDAISPLLPGVIRGSADGKLIFRYVCQPSSVLQDRIEVLRFDSALHQFKTSTIHFSGITRPAAQTQVLENPAECLKCHQSEPLGTLADHIHLKPVWDAYPLWPGLYGSNDDYLHPSKSQRNYAKDSFPTAMNPDLEAAAFQKFSANEASNPCYRESIPGNLEDLYRADQPVGQTNSRQPNLRFSQVLGQLSAQALVQRASESPQFDSLLPVLARASFGCGEKQVSDPDDEKNPTGDLTAPRKGLNAELLSALQALGIHDADLDLSLHGIDGYDFVGGFYAGSSYHDQDVTYLSMVRSQIAERLARKAPDLKLYYSLSRGISEYYVEDDNSCVDDLGGRLTLSKKNRMKACDLIRQTWYETTRLPLSEAKDSPAFSKSQLLTLKSTPGYQVFVNSCATCHAEAGNDRAPQYLANPDAFIARVATDADFAARIQSRISSADAPMPPDDSLAEGEIKSILDFIAQAKKIH